MFVILSLYNKIDILQIFCFVTTFCVFVFLLDKHIPSKVGLHENCVPIDKQTEGKIMSTT